MVNIQYKLPFILNAICLVYALKGLDPAKNELYKASSDGTWKCLDGSKTILYSAINDDYCDCPDGSDEPGTSACSSGIFYCGNIGHVSSVIKSSAVNDGVCDEECCDGSDEDGSLIHCPNRCKEVRKAYLEYQNSLKFSTEKGLKAKEKLILDASKQVELWEEEKFKLEDTIFLKKAEILKLKRQLKILDQSKKKKCKTHQSEIEGLKNSIDVLQKTLNGLKDILSKMKRDYNHNFHDMAVKSAIIAYDEFIIRYETLEFEIKNQIEEIESNQNSTEEEEEDDEEVEEKEKIILNTKVKVKHTVLDVIYEKLNSILPESIKSNKIISKIIRKDNVLNKNENDLKDIEKVRELIDKKEKEIDEIVNNLNVIEKELEFDYGLDDVWLKLKDICIEKNEGEYTYSLCILGDVYQKSNKDNTRTHLGKFKSFGGDNQDLYHSHIHKDGTRCWNGPNRSVKVMFECGSENLIESVTEPEKCEYHFTAKSPAVC